MSDMDELSSMRKEEEVNIPFLPETKVESQPKLESLSRIDETIDSQSYFLGEVPQLYLVDPNVSLPLNSDRLNGSVNMNETLAQDAMALIQEEVTKIQALQKKIHFWEERIALSKSEITTLNQKIQQNHSDMTYDKKNRDYWLGRAEEVVVDYHNAEAANRPEEWLWLIKKYGLKNVDGVQIHPEQEAFDEICKLSADNLIAEYKNAGNKYEQSRRDRECECNRLIREISRLKNSIDTLQGYIALAYNKEIEPLQDGVLLLKEFNVKIRSFGQDSKSCFGDMRSWAESFINDFLKSNPRVPQNIVTEFRKLASIPLPAENC